MPNYIQLASDNFTRADVNPIGSPWAPLNAVQTNLQLQISNNKALANVVDSNHVQGDYYSTITWPNDQYSEVVISTLLTSGAYIGPAVRCQNTNADNLYWVACATGANASFLQKVVNGVGSGIGSSFTIAQGDTVRLAIQGSTLTVFQNGTLILTGTDSTFATGYAGVGAYIPAGQAVGSAIVDSWLGGMISLGNWNSSYRDFVNKRGTDDTPPKYW